MDIRNKLTLAPPAPTSDLSSSVITPSATAAGRPFHYLTGGPSVSPASHLALSYVMQNSEIVEDVKNKAALSFILTSSDSESDTERFKTKHGSMTVVTPTNRKCLGKSTRSNAVLPGRKGSKYCSVEGCTSRAKHAKRCWKHGGSVKCKVLGCVNRAKSRGACWSHGGGTVCSLETCETISVSNGFCWAHGGGKRCQVPHCSKPAYERTLNYCQTHFDELSTTDPRV
ncbi:uncharacterized protein PHALS_02108 [Plasmopara halstedii]|uniref:WRKY19-like zinc finger domain-containing protein n=1 Tax=Plasmopara halstedii TaxID=4781 RepID=A0A0P1AXA2_PLAHL|nr:uncharacterized protein PHALS_02108 [Plasmopara halstedii]CEG45837.1 hypothetical protein PHALS_02108 [Plasmopara halstedii]|eukprot:XP_024582206.1 hypothetical protein PHALS_02108 [Plasmopara halstedii]